MKTILVITGTRAEYGLLRSTMDAIRAHPELKLKLLVTGMHTLKNFGDTQKEIRKDGYSISYTVPIGEKDDQLQALNKEMAGIRAYCIKNRPDCVLVLGDRDEPLAAAIVAAHLNIPLAHIHGGDVTGPGVDEANRHAITKMAHIHFPGTKKSAVRIRKMAEEPKRIHTAGSVVVDMALRGNRYGRTEVAKKLHLDPNLTWLTILQHPTAFDDTPIEQQIRATLDALQQFPHHEKIIIGPNNDTGSITYQRALKAIREPRTHYVASLPREIFMSVVKESEALVGNSSAGIIETAYLGTPTVNIGNRQKGREHGDSVLNTPYAAARIATAIRAAAQLKKKRRGHPFPSPYGKAGSGKRIADILAKSLASKGLLHKNFAG